MSNTAHDPLPIDQRPVGDLLGAELEARGWSQADFAAVIDRPTQYVSEVVTGKKEITRESAAQIGAALSQSPEYWLNLQDQYLLAEQVANATTQAKLDDVRRRARLNGKGPIQLLLKRKILTGSTLDELEAEVMDLFELKSMEDEPEFAAAAKRANQDEDISMLQRAWVACIRKGAKELPPVEQYSPERLKDLAATLPRMVTSPTGFIKLPEKFADTGVRLVFVEALTGAKIDGCAMLVDGYPVIGLSGRGKRLDKVLFTLLHEIAHLLRGHVNAESLIVEDLEERQSSESINEKEANEDSLNWLFPGGYPLVPPRISAPWVDQQAAELRLARIVLVGQLQKRGRLDWRTTLAKNPPVVSEVLLSWQ